MDACSLKAVDVSFMGVSPKAVPVNDRLKSKPLTKVFTFLQNPCGGLIRSIRKIMLWSEYRLKNQ
jgi:hypothetical protein